MERVRRTVPAISISEVRSLLKKGYTRLADDDEGFGSIQEHYNISVAGVRNLFKSEYLKGLKTVFPEFELIIDVDDIPIVEDDEIAEIPDEVHAMGDLIRANEARSDIFEELAKAVSPHMDHERASSLFAGYPKGEVISEDLFK